MAEESGNKKPAVETEQSHLKLSETLVGSQGDACGVSRCVGKRELHGEKKGNKELTWTVIGPPVGGLEGWGDLLCINTLGHV